MKSEWVNVQFGLVKYRDTVSKHQISIYVCIVENNYFDSEYQLRNTRGRFLLICCGIMESSVVARSLGKCLHYYISLQLDLIIWITCDLNMLILANL